MLWIILLVLTLIAILVFTLNKKSYGKSAVKVNESYTCEDGNFKVSGDRNCFIIEKDKQYDFLVQNGLIVACKDKRISSKFVYYGGGSSEDVQ